MIRPSHPGPCLLVWRLWLVGQQKTKQERADIVARQVSRWHLKVASSKKKRAEKPWERESLKSKVHDYDPNNDKSGGGGAPWTGIIPAGGNQHTPVQVFVFWA